jgi:hypothetical protein
MFPHKEVAEDAYLFVVQKLGDKSAANRPIAALLSNGIENLKWSTLSEEAKWNALEQSDESLFFRFLEAEFILWFYSNPEVWPGFGYEGASNDKGGYLNRGFNDIDWIDRVES